MVMTSGMGSPSRQLRAASVTIMASLAFLLHRVRASAARASASAA
jgi:hypothetical protein